MPGRDTVVAVAGAALAVGGIAVLGLLGFPPLAFAGGSWRLLFGWLAWPLALATVGAGLGLWRRRDWPPARLPWTRALGTEVTVASALALLALAWGHWEHTAVPSDASAGGLVGWALAAAVAGRVGATPAIGLWFLAGVAGAAVAVGLVPISSRAPGGGSAAVRTPGAAARASAGAGRRRIARPREAAPSPVGLPPEGSSSAAASPVAAARALDEAAGAVRAGDDAAGAARAEVIPLPAPRAGRLGRLPPPETWADDRPAEEGDEALAAMADALRRTLASFGVPVEVAEIERGPTVTRFGLRPGIVVRGSERRRVRVARITALRDDLALALSAPSLRIEAPIPGRPLVGVEVPGPRGQRVGLRRLVTDPAFRRVGRGHRLALPIGRSVSGEPVIADLAALPHLLLAGATGTGKSVCLTALLCGLLSQNTPDRLRLVLVDPKRVEFARLARLPHLLARPVQDAEEAVAALRWLLAEMDGRYQRFAERRARDLHAFNRTLPAGQAPLPVLVLAIDELADLMLTAPEEFEPLLTRIAQLGRATGIHLLLATQRPSVDVLTGLIKANFPARIAFAVASQADSRVILDQPGAEALLGRGDLLFLSPDAPGPRRAQGACVGDDEVDRLVGFWARGHWPPPRPPAPWLGLVATLDPEERLLERAEALCRAHERVSPSLLQRRLRVGYGKARQLYDRLAADGLVGGGAEADEAEAGGDWVDDEFDRAP